MPRPCHAIHPDPAQTATACRLCWHWHNQTQYRRVWERSEEDADTPDEVDADAIDPKMCVRCLLRKLDGGREGWPAGWPHWPVTAEAYRLAFAGVVAGAVEPLSWDAPRGIVISSGGWRFFGSLYVAVRVLRHVGCTLPVEVWYLGPREFDPRMAGLLEPFGPVYWVDAVAYCAEHGIRRRNLGGWELKPFAARHSRFREIISLDADCYPIFDPTFLFDHPEYREAGAIFWPDNPGDPYGRLEPGQWQRWGVPYRDEPSFESGQFVVDRSRCARALAVTDWMNDHSDYTYLHQYGDKDTFHLGWRATATAYAMAPRTRWQDVAFVHHDLEGGMLFIHRCRDKFRVSSEWGTFGYATEQRGPANVFSAGLPHEEFCHRALAELDRSLNPEREFSLRPNTWDKDIWHHVTLLNEYRLPASFTSEDVILDIGGHIGAFAHAVLSRGAGQVHVVEPDPENLSLLRRNLARHGGRAVIHAGAAWRSDVTCCSLPFASSLDRINTGACSALPAGSESKNGLIPVPALRFDDLVQTTLAGGSRLRLVKLDCEGSEFPILLTSTTLHLADEIVGEYHERADIPAHAVVPGFVAYTKETLAAVLQAAGFAVTLHPSGPGLGLFFAQRGA